MEGNDAVILEGAASLLVRMSLGGQHFAMLGVIANGSNGHKNGAVGDGLQARSCAGDPLVREHRAPSEIVFSAVCPITLAGEAAKWLGGVVIMTTLRVRRRKNWHGDWSVRGTERACGPTSGVNKPPTPGAKTAWRTAR